MLTSLFESLFVTIVNGAARRHPAAPATAALPPAGQTVLGRTVPLLPGSDGAFHEPETAALSPDERLRHVYAIGATGSGKTNLLLRLIENDIEAGHSLCVVDLRGDLVDRILPRLAATGRGYEDRLLLLDLRDASSVVPFNPLQGPGDAYSRALHVLAVLRAQAESWGVQLEETLRNALVALAESGWSLLELEPLLSNAAFRAETLAGVSDRYVRSFFERYGALSEEKQVTWRLPVLNKVTPLLCLPQLRLMFGQRGSVAFGPMFNGRPGTVALVSLAVDRLHGASYLVGSLLVSVFQNAMMARVNVPERERTPVHLYVDEFETMATDRFEAIVAEGRRFGLGLCLSHQNLSQLPQGLRQVLRNNVHTQLYFQTGAVDAGDLAREVVCDASREDVTRALMTQGVGEAFLVRRGGDTVRIRVPRSVDPIVGRAEVEALRASAARNFAVAKQEAEAELARREAFLDALDKTTGNKPPATYEVRHGKTDNFKPRPAQ